LIVVVVVGGVDCYAVVVTTYIHVTLPLPGNVGWIWEFDLRCDLLPLRFFGGSLLHLPTRSAHIYRLLAFVLDYLPTVDYGGHLQLFPTYTLHLARAHFTHIHTLRTFAGCALRCVGWLIWLLRFWFGRRLQLIRLNCHTVTCRTRLFITYGCYLFLPGYFATIRSRTLPLHTPTLRVGCHCHTARLRSRSSALPPAFVTLFPLCLHCYRCR